jgi:hypothetical protein
METRLVPGNEIVEIAEYIPEWPLWQLEPGVINSSVVKKHTYRKKKFAFGNMIRSVYVHVEMPSSEAESHFFLLMTKLFDLFVEG